MGTPALVVENLSKAFDLCPTRNITSWRESLVAGLQSPFTKTACSHEPFWALRDLSFTVPSGQVLGIIGNNGAGKSTLLKILSRVTAPTHGKIEIYGRIGALLEVGTGFHADLSGRDNILLNGALLGMSRAETLRYFDSIVSFAEIEEFIDMPVKFYSSGMYIRLAFAVAAHLEPDILIVDEVLAVGDLRFQKKCLERMEKIASSGQTIVFVSHDMGAVKQFCSHVLWLQKGTIAAIGPAQEVINCYMESCTATPTHAKEWEGDDKPIYGSITLHAIKINAARMPLSEQIDIDIDYTVEPHATPTHLAIALSGEEGRCMVTSREGKPLSTDPGRYRCRCTLNPYLLNPQRYTLSLSLYRPESPPLLIDHLLTFEAIAAGEERWPLPGTWRSALRPQLLWTTTPLGEC
jgi:lipopolysaccharide transport system ATP-binding protein